MFEQTGYPTENDPPMLHNFKFFAVVRDAAAEFNQSHSNLRAAYSGNGAWEQGHAVDPSGEDEPP